MNGIERIKTWVQKKCFSDEAVACAFKHQPSILRFKDRGSAGYIEIIKHRLAILSFIQSLVQHLSLQQTVFAVHSFHSSSIATEQ
jgi:hypothetical protein